MAELNDNPLSAKFNIPAAREGSIKNNESEIVLLRRALKTTNNDLQIRVPLRSENYVPGVSGWSFNLAGDAELNSAFIRGTLVAADGLFSGNLQAAGGTFTGTLQGVDGTFTGNLSATQITADFLSVNRLQINSIPGDRMANLSITADKIANLSITAAQIADLTISTGKIANGAVTEGKIGNLAISAGKIQNGAIIAEKISDLTITAGKISNLTITADKIADLTITGAKIANATIGSAKIVSLAAEKISAGTITSVGLSNSTNITTLGLTVSVNAASFQAGLTSTTGAFSSVLSNAGMPASTDFGLPTVQRRADNILVRFTSSARYKKNIVPVESPSAVLDLKLRKYDALDDSSFNQVGLIAEEVDALGLSPLVKYDSEGRPDGVSYELVGAMLAPHVKALEARVTALENANG